jgi:hypothetical protein
MAEKSKNTSTNDQESGSKKKIHPMDNESGIEQQNASGSRGGTADMGHERATTGTRKTGRSASGIRTKRSVTGSDYDGQVAPE